MKIYKCLFKIFSLEEWETIKKKGKLKLKEIYSDQKFIHLCTEDQLQETIEIHFKEVKKIIVVKLNSKGLEKKLRWEKSRNNDFFPHHYGDISFKNILDITEIKNK